MAIPNLPEEYDQLDQWTTLMMLYNSALKEVQTRVNILSDEFQHINHYNPIEHVKARIKTPESIVKKLKRLGFEATIDNMYRELHDIAGIRIVCSFTSDIYYLADAISRQNDVEVLMVKDYIANPKPNGYRSYHMVISVPIYLSSGQVEMKVEIQIRTIAMDFWASLEHKIQYKFEGAAPEHMRESLKECADMAAVLDERMLALNESLQREEKKV
ncbi:GTP pyrophosphokinase [Fusibacillus kribbianus]|uniref:GTP pyrophosphokinase family protein n=1 Tax=Fusibacillus kribbianus TaxID=3044208 RepID=A0AAP4BD10_9FIRM|nr:GTP pyrophosphokinase family protein [Ruminococcus sp. YH-rum2234]MDI9242963.1 GTP pyrophosphokinase family protein [Ruminococcus sp. YH-rum2234]